MSSIFNLNGEIKLIRGLNGSWPHPFEWLKRTDGNDWGFYTVGSVNNFRKNIQLTGEYYYPCLTYPSNSIWDLNPYVDPRISGGFAAWSQLYANLYEMEFNGVHSEIKKFLNQIIENNDNILYKKSQKLHSIIGDSVSVLPPDTRHVDYEVIPLMIADGCLYHCRFCCVKSKKKFKTRSKENILQQINELKSFYGLNLENYNSLFLGNHDALGADEDIIDMAITEACNGFGFKNSNRVKPGLFLFGSVDSFLNGRDELFKKIDKSPFETFINIGLESIDPETISDIRKPLDVSEIRKAFNKMLSINQEYENIEITANFLIGEQLSSGHFQSLVKLLGSVPDSLSKKGTIYLSPLIDNQKREELLHSFFEIKKKSKLPAYIYQIQRL